jgi:hypothetical protein
MTDLVMTFCVLVSHRIIFPSAPALANIAPFGDHANAVISPICPPEKLRWRSPSFFETTTISLVPVATAKALPSGCHAALEVASLSVSNLLMTPSIFLTNSGSSVLTE